ncbi:hypothetical protein E3N88_44432 [Mikania micrantha]|uniref:Uncharacterized protein n=1 Tax=Mikania micrantha TaxID=192012 RepID=A0A5N6LC09_9ASTR|nr:hypothetical protein E3N88_44432 [Mikania micrantha]
MSTPVDPRAFPLPFGRLKARPLQCSNSASCTREKMRFSQRNAQERGDDEGEKLVRDPAWAEPCTISRLRSSAMIPPLIELTEVLRDAHELLNNLHIPRGIPTFPPSVGVLQIGIRAWVIGN